MARSFLRENQIKDEHLLTEEEHDNWDHTGIPGCSASGTAVTFLDLTDTPSTYEGSEGYYLKVTATGTGVEFAVTTEGAVPTGGDINQVLKKESAVDGDYDWGDQQKLITASGAPGSTTGNENDHYIDLINGDIYQKGPDAGDLNDEFTGADNDPPSLTRWDTFESANSGNGQAMYISGNTLYTYQQGSSSGANSYYYGVEAKTELIGDFVIETFVTNWTGTTNRAAQYFAVAGVGNIHLYDDGTKWVRIHNGSDYVKANINSNPNNITLRLQRSGSTFYAQYKQDGAGSFTTLDSWTVSTSDGAAQLYSYVYDHNGNGSANWDYYHIISGGVEDPWELQRDNPNSFIEFNDTPSTYTGSEDDLLVSTGSGIAFDTASGIKYPEKLYSQPSYLGVVQAFEKLDGFNRGGLDIFEPSETYRFRFTMDGDDYNFRMYNAVTSGEVHIVSGQNHLAWFRPFDSQQFFHDNVVVTETYYNSSSHFGGIQVRGGGASEALFGVDNDTGWAYIYAEDEPIITGSDGGVTKLYCQGVAIALAGGANWRPNTDDVYDLGTIGSRWDDIFATNSTINTSDERVKTEIYASDLGLDFINELEPVSYKFKDHDYTYEKHQDGEVLTLSGTKTFHRTHYGLIAQDVETTLSGMGIDTEDFAGFCYDSEEDRYALRYGEFMAPMMKAIQEMSDIIDTQAATISGLEARIEALEGQ